MKKKLPCKAATLSRKPAIRAARLPAVKSRRRTLALFTVGAWGVAHGLTTTRRAEAQSAPFKVGVKSLTFSAKDPKPGETVSITMVVTTTGRGRRSVPWEILVNNKRIAGGVERNVTAGRGFTKRIRWRATPGLNNFLAKADPRNTFRERGRDLRDNTRGQSVRVAAAAATRRSAGRSTTTQPAKGSTTSRSRASGRVQNKIEVSVSSFQISPNTPKFDQNANLRAKFKVRGTGAQDVKWIIKRGSATIASGIQRNAQAGRSYTIDKTWRANFGNHTFGFALDPEKQLDERRSDNVRTLSVSIAPKWGEWGTDALQSAVAAVRLWQAQARFTGIKVFAVNATGSPGVLKGPAIKTHMKSVMIAKGVPAIIADKFSDAVSRAWGDWQNRVMVPGLPWYPAFAAFPGPSAPPMPNVATPLISLPSSNAGKLSPNSLKSAIKSKLGPLANTDGAEAAIQNFAVQFNNRFVVWSAAVPVVNVMGRGPVPAFAPPYVPVGPVMNGSAQSAPGASLSGRPF